jgi:hypothetical protein
MVLDLARGDINVTNLKSRDQQIAYVSKLGKDLPDLNKASSELRPVEGLEDRDFKPAATPKPKRKPKPPVLRKTLIPRDCYFTVSNAKIAEIAKELRSLELIYYPHSISVLFRVFLEQSTDHYLTAAGIALSVTTPNGAKDKSLRAKVGEAIKEMVKAGTREKDLAGVARGIDNKNSPLSADTLNSYIHNRFFSPTERELKVAWDNAQLYFEKIWK